MPLPSLIAEVLRTRIWTGQWEWGQKIAEQTVATEFGVSRTVLREALRTVEAEGLVITEPRRGTFVRAFTAQDLEDLGEARRVLEEFAFRIAVRRVTPATLSQLGRIIRDMEEASAKDNWEALLDADLRFHGTVIQACGNAVIGGFYASLQGQIRMVFARFRFEYPDPSFLSREHQRLLQLVRDENEGVVVDAITAHIQDGTARLKRRLEES